MAAVASNSGVDLVRVLLRLEGAAALVAGIAVYGLSGGGWPIFILLLVVPDLSIAGYLRGPAVGAAIYNAVHNWAVAGVILGLGMLLDQTLLFDLGAALTAHIGGDRLLGYGLKYPTSFQDTHLGRIGRRA